LSTHVVESRPWGVWSPGFDIEPFEEAYAGKHNHYTGKHILFSVHPRGDMQMQLYIHAQLHFARQVGMGLL
jgi:hypothetical protein